jgi:hypothetical protein
MTESSQERRRLFNQAVHGFAQRHPDHTKAGIEIHLAQAVSLSVASVQRWRAGYPIAAWHIPALVEWAVRQAGMNRRWLRSFLRHCAFVDDGLEERLFDSTGIPSSSLLSSACQAANMRLWGKEHLSSAAMAHLPRVAPLTLIESFLASEKPGLILVGASGLGKTSLALWLATNRFHTGLPTLVYPAILLDGTRTLSELLRDTLKPHLDQMSIDRRATLTWSILVIFDGVNESPEMRRLTWQIDRGLVEAQGLKVILTFRPESFQIARHSLTLTEHCFFCDELESGEDSSSKSLQGLSFASPAVHLQPFTLEELPQAYDLYRQTYALQTSYDDLPVPLRQPLRHPLTLRLIAQAFAGEHLPEQVNSDQLVQLLLDAFIADGRLERRDIRFLEDELMPLMMSPGHWSNVITVEQMATARTVDGRRLITPGEPGPLTRLADAGLLAATNGRLDDPLRFAHERFYEHFAWRRLRQLRATSPDTQDFCIELADKPPFLYGPARRLLAEEVSQRPIEWLADLARRSDQPLRDFLLIGALEDWGRGYPDKVHPCLDRLWMIGQPRIARVLNWVGLQTPEPCPESLRIQRVAVSVAGTLGDEALLTRALLTGSPTIQQVVASKVLHLWQADPTTGQHILADVGRRIAGRLGLPNWSASLAFLQLLAALLFDPHRLAEDRVFLSGQIRVAVRSAFNSRWRLLLLRYLVNWLVGTWEHMIANDLGTDSTFDSTFQISPDQRQHLEALAQFIDWETPGLDTVATYEHIRAALDIGGLVATWYVTIPLTVRGLLHQPEAEALILTLLREACETQPPCSWAMVAIWIANDIASRQPSTNHDLRAALDVALSQVIGSYPQWHEAYRASRIKPPRRLMRPVENLALYFAGRDMSGLPVTAGPVWAVVSERLEVRDVNFILDYLLEMQNVVRDHHRPLLALRLIRPVLSCSDETVQRALAKMLAWIKTMAAEDVRELINSGAVPPELVALVRQWHIEDTTADRVFFGGWGLMYQLLLESHTARQVLSYIFGQAMRFTSMRAWMTWAAQLVLNVLSGQDLFPVAIPDT